MAELVYTLCGATSLFCTILLWRGYKKNLNQLLFWSAICFFGFALNNIMLIVDFMTPPEFNLSVLRLVPALFGISALIWGLTRQARP